MEDKPLKQGKYYPDDPVIFVNSAGRPFKSIVMKIKAPWDRYLMMVGLSLVVSLFRLKEPFWQVWGISFLYTFMYWEGNYQVVTYMRKKYPKLRQTTRRILTQVGLSLLYTLGINILLVLLLHITSLVPYNREFHLSTLYMGLAITAIISSLYETVFFFQLWKEALLESERLKKTEARLQFESLKNQVNPHFLFNSLNTLSALIHVDPDKAEQFVQEFSRIYRYVLQVKDKTFVPLEEEISFVQSYVFLQKIRFDNQLIVTNNINGVAGKYFIPPLILQNLVENCIKHNVISEKQPLYVELSLQDAILTVKNVLQERESRSDSTKTGLYNIKHRLKLLSEQEARFYKKDGYFYAEVPLLESE